MVARPSGTSPVLLALTAFTLLALPAVISAQDKDGDFRVFSFSEGRPRLGVTVDYRADKDRDRIGAHLVSVTPDGPADKAGLKAGDIITRFNGTALGGLKGDDEEESGPAMKLVELARKLEPGDTVSIEYRRDNDTRTTKVIAQDLGELGLARRWRMQTSPMPGRPGPEFFPRMPMMLEGGPGDLHFRFDGDPRGLRLADLNADLGEYFGTKSGVLVLETPRDSTLPLKAGDVILSIDGRAPTSEAHARRILNSYDAGETAKLEIMRKQKKMTVTWKAPDREWKWKTRTPGRAKVEVERS
jgi:C-terminal processing protease CtpA/Prc